MGIGRRLLGLTMLTDETAVNSSSVQSARTATLVLPRRQTPSQKTMVRVLQNQRGGLKYATASDAAISNYMYNTFLSFEPSLPVIDSPAPRILDIGCGLGVYHVYMHRHYGFRSEHFLVDRALYQIGEKGYERHTSKGGFHSVEEMPFYTSETCAREIALSNGFGESKWHWVNATEANVRSIKPVGFAMSLLSWGYHYPVDTYAAAVRSVLKRKTGRLLITLRAPPEEGLKSLESAGFVCEAAPQGKRPTIGNGAALTLCRVSPSVR